MPKFQFTEEVFNEIILLLKQRFCADKQEQKRIRAKIRKLGFYISDYHKGFSDIDFKNLVKSGQIEIIGKNNNIFNSTNKSRKLLSNSHNRKQSLPPIIFDDTKYLILGTMPGEKSLQNQEYYNNPKNQFWKIISLLFNNGNPFLNYNEKIEILERNNVGLWDVLSVCEREGSSDASIRKQQINDFDTLFKKYPSVQKLIFNGKDSFKYFVAKSNKEYIKVSSTSSANTHKTLDEKVQEWKIVFQ